MLEIRCGEWDALAYDTVLLITDGWGENEVFLGECYGLTSEKCPRCGELLYVSDLCSYPYVCFKCDENFSQSDKRIIGQDVLADFLLTNEFNAEKIAKEREMVKQLSEDPQEQELLLLAMDYVSETTMRNALDYLNGEYGSPVGYITQELGLTEDQITELQNKFLE
jgi:hypothetical protein